MYDLETLLPLILSMLPAIISIVISLRAYIIIAARILRVDNKNDDTRVLVNRVLKDNYDLKKRIDQLLTEIDRIKRE